MYIMYIGLEYVSLALNTWDAVTQESTSSFILYCKNFGRFYFRTLFLSEIKIVRNFLQVMCYDRILYSRMTAYRKHYIAVSPL